MRFPLLYTTVMINHRCLNVYGQPALFGGPENTPGTYDSYSKARFRLGYFYGGLASTMSVLLGIIIVVFSALQFKLQAKD